MLAENDNVVNTFYHAMHYSAMRASTASCSPRLGVRNHNPKLHSLLSQERVNYGLKIWQIHSQGPSEQKPVKNFLGKGASAYPRTAQIFWVPLLSRNR